MLQIKSSELTDAYIKTLDEDEKLWIYNGLDCCIPIKIWEVTRPQITEANLDKIYRFEISLIPVAIDMMLRGFNVNTTYREDLRIQLMQDRKKYVDHFNDICVKAFDRPFLITSHEQLKLLFYDYLKIQEVNKRDKGEWKVTIGEEALEKVRESPRASFLADLILKVREFDKKIQVVACLLDEDGRLRFSVSVGGTETGRWSSKKSVRRRGTNSQNITKDLRKMLIADKGYILCYSDLRQAESRAVAYESEDEDYIFACESDDLHLTVARMVYKEVQWTNNYSEDIKLANEEFFRHFSRRDLCKRGAHGTNYLLKPPSLSKHLHIPISAAIRFQLAYYGGEISRIKLEKIHKELNDPLIARWLDEDSNQLVRIRGAFPGIRKWHKDIYEELHQNNGILYNAFGFRRQFWSRLDDDSTHREAVAFKPQSLVAYLTSIAIRRIYHELRGDVQILGMIHDAVVSQVRREALDELAPEIIKCMTNSTEIKGRTMIVPSSLEYGENWKEMKEWKMVNS